MHKWIVAAQASLFLAGLGVGAIIVPASLIATIICPDDLSAMRSDMVSPQAFGSHCLLSRHATVKAGS